MEWSYFLIFNLGLSEPEEAHLIVSTTLILERFRFYARGEEADFPPRSTPAKLITDLQPYQHGSTQSILLGGGNPTPSEPSSSFRNIA